MKTLTLLATGIFALSLTACGNADTAAETDTAATETTMEAPTGETMDHSSHAMGEGKTGHGTGAIISLGSQGDTLTIDHGPIDGIGMGAMTMGFNTQGDVDLSAFSEGDQVAFMVKKGRDDSFRITAICNTDSDGVDCLKGLMEHSK